MSLFPCFACLVGILVEARVTLPARDGWAEFLCWYQRALAILIFLAGAIIAAISWIRPDAEIAQTERFFPCSISRVASWPPAGSGGFRRS